MPDVFSTDDSPIHPKIPFSLKNQCSLLEGELHSNSWNLTFANKLQFPLILWSFSFKASKNW